MRAVVLAAVAAAFAGAVAFSAAADEADSSSRDAGAPTRPTLTNARELYTPCPARPVQPDRPRATAENCTPQNTGNGTSESTTKGFRAPMTHSSGSMRSGYAALDWCRVAGADCGKPAADEFCARQDGGLRPHGLKIAQQSDLSETVHIGDHTLCHDAGCTGFAVIICGS